VINGLVQRTWFLLCGLWSSLLGAPKQKLTGLNNTEKTSFLMTDHEKKGG
jgi:hypothetical protein